MAQQHLSNHNFDLQAFTALADCSFTYYIHLITVCAVQRVFLFQAQNIGNKRIRYDSSFCRLEMGVSHSLEMCNSDGKQPLDFRASCFETHPKSSLLLEQVVAPRTVYSTSCKQMASQYLKDSRILQNIARNLDFSDSRQKVPSGGSIEFGKFKWKIQDAQHQVFSLFPLRMEASLSWPSFQTASREMKDWRWIEIREKWHPQSQRYICLG